LRNKARLLCRICRYAMPMTARVANVLTSK
jgi:hypothetical protein